MAAANDLQGEMWPEAVGRPLETVFLPSETISKLVEKEEQAGRTRLELSVSRDPENKSWQYDMAPPSALATAGKGTAVPRGLASALPAQVRLISDNPFPLGMPAQAPVGPLLTQDRGFPGPSRGRLFDQAQGRSALPIVSGSNALRPAQALPQRKPMSESSQIRESESKDVTWRPPSRAAEDLYKQTKTSPPLYYRPVEIVAAGRRLRDIERENRKVAQPARRMPPGVRDSYRP